MFKGNSLSSSVGMMFTTKDNDNDKYRGRNCAKIKKGAWWYNKCIDSNLNGQDLRGETKKKSGITWKSWKGYSYSLNSVVMKITAASAPKPPRPAALVEPELEAFSKRSKDCKEVGENDKSRPSGVYTVYVGGQRPIQVYCDLESDDGYWTVCIRQNTTFLPRDAL